MEKKEEYFKQKYLKYKEKYLQLKKSELTQFGGFNNNDCVLIKTGNFQENYATIIESHNCVNGIGGKLTCQTYKVNIPTSNGDVMIILTENDLESPNIDQLKFKIDDYVTLTSTIEDIKQNQSAKYNRDSIISRVKNYKPKFNNTTSKSELALELDCNSHQPGCSGVVFDSEVILATSRNYVGQEIELQTKNASDTNSQNYLGYNGKNGFITKIEKNPKTAGFFIYVNKNCKFPVGKDEIFLVDYPGHIFFKASELNCQHAI